VRGLRPGLFSYLAQARSLLNNFQPDVIWACSDALHAIFGYRLAAAYRTKCVIDLYDNFEAFGVTNIPGLRQSFRHAVRQADGVSCFSQPLADYVVSSYPRDKATTVIESGFDPQLFYPRDRAWCRQQLGLPVGSRIIGTAGALHRSRDIESLFHAYAMLAQTDEDLHLALAGPREKGLRIPSGPRIHDLQQLPHDKVPLLMGSLDVGVVSYKNSPQGRFSFPQKLYEMLACRTPLVAAAVGCAREVMRELPQCLFEPKNPIDLARAVSFQLTHHRIPDGAVPTWQAMAGELERFFGLLLDERRPAAAQSPL